MRMFAPPFSSQLLLASVCYVNVYTEVSFMRAIMVAMLGAVWAVGCCFFPSPRRFSGAVCGQIAFSVRGTPAAPSAVGRAGACPRAFGQTMPSTAPRSGRCAHHSVGAPIRTGSGLNIRQLPHATYGMTVPTLLTGRRTSLSAATQIGRCATKWASLGTARGKRQARTIPWAGG